MSHVDAGGLSLEDVDLMVEEEDVSKISTPSSEPPKPKRKNESMVWTSFIKKYVGDPPRPRAFCKYCDADYAADGNKNGTKNLLDHLTKCKKNPNQLPPKQDKRQKTLAYEKGVEGDENPSNLVLAKKFDHNHAIALRQALAEFLIVDELPFRIVESPKFRKFVQMLEPRFQVPSRMTIARTCMDIFKEKKAWLKCMMRACDSRVCLTTDAWTSIQNLSYMVVTAHWIDKEWKLQKRVISFRLIDNHKGDTIGAQVEECLHDWGIDKIMTITVDNASSNDTAIGYLKRHLRSNVLNGLYIHMRCAAHIMNLVVGDGLKINDDAITRVRDAIRYVRSSPARLIKFNQCVEKERIECSKSLCLDVSTRWNSTYLMLDVAEKYEFAFDRMESDDVDYRPHFTEGECGKRNLGPPTKEDWTKIRVFCKFLELFYDATVQFSGSLYVTSNSYFHGLYGVHSHLCRYSQSTDKRLKDMADIMMVKYQKYWGRNDRLNLLIFIANVIDPRSKLQVMGQMVRLMYGGIEGEKLVASISDLFRALFDEYALGLPQAQVHASSTTSVPPPPGPPPVVAGSGSKLTLFEDYWSMAVSFGTYSSSPSANLEIDRYLADPLVAPDKNFDVLKWWKDNDLRYPVIARIARDVLAIPISTVSSESAFSTGGRVLDPFRSSLAPATVEALICTQDWLRRADEKEPIDIKETLDCIECYDMDSVMASNSISTAAAELGTSSSTTGKT